MLLEAMDIGIAMNRRNGDVMRRVQLLLLLSTTLIAIPPPPYQR